MAAAGRYWLERHWPDAADFLAGPVVADVNKLLLETRDAFPEALALLGRKRLLTVLPISEGAGITERLIYRLLHPGGADSSDGFDYVGAYPVEVLHWVVRIIGCELSVYLRERLAS